MRHLDLFKSRRYSTVKLSDGKEYKLPNEYSVEEVERVFELREELETLEAVEVIGDGLAQAKRHTDLVFAQLEIMFQHYQPELTNDYLRKVITHGEALETIGFFQKYRHLALKEMREEDTADKAESKKKALASRELRDLRRMVIFMVTYGFSLLEVRKLYIDEAHEYYKELVHNLEQQGKLKEGSYDKIKSSNKGTGVADTVNLLRKQMYKSIAKNTTKR
jgi:hypothetical protein